MKWDSGWTGVEVHDKALCTKSRESLRTEHFGVVASHWVSAVEFISKIDSAPATIAKAAKIPVLNSIDFIVAIKLYQSAVWVTVNSKSAAKAKSFVGESNFGE